MVTSNRAFFLQLINNFIELTLFQMNFGLVIVVCWKYDVSQVQDSRGQSYDFTLVLVGYSHRVHGFESGIQLQLFIYTIHLEKEGEDVWFFLLINSVLVIIPCNKNVGSNNCSFWGQPSRNSPAFSHPSHCTVGRKCGSLFRADSASQRETFPTENWTLFLPMVDRLRNIFPRIFPVESRVWKLDYTTIQRMTIPRLTKWRLDFDILMIQRLFFLKKKRPKVFFLPLTGFT